MVKNLSLVPGNIHPGNHRAKYSLSTLSKSILYALTRKKPSLSACVKSPHPQLASHRRALCVQQDKPSTCTRYGIHNKADNTPAGITRAIRKVKGKHEHCFVYATCSSIGDNVLRPVAASAGVQSLGVPPQRERRPDLEFLPVASVEPRTPYRALP